MEKALLAKIQTRAKLQYLPDPSLLASTETQHRTPTMALGAKLGSEDVYTHGHDLPVISGDAHRLNVPLHSASRTMCWGHFFPL